MKNAPFRFEKGAIWFAQQVVSLLFGRNGRKEEEIIGSTKSHQVKNIVVIALDSQQQTNEMVTSWTPKHLPCNAWTLQGSLKCSSSPLILGCFYAINNLYGQLLFLYL